jgi:hypothetical protein
MIVATVIASDGAVDQRGRSQVTRPRRSTVQSTPPSTMPVSTRVSSGTPPRGPDPNTPSPSTASSVTTATRAASSGSTDRAQVGEPCADRCDLDGRRLRHVARTWAVSRSDGMPAADT